MAQHLYAAKVYGGYRINWETWSCAWCVSDEAAINEIPTFIFEGIAADPDLPMIDIVRYLDSLDFTIRPSLEELALELYNVELYRVDDARSEDFEFAEEAEQDIATGNLPMECLTRIN